MGAPPIVALPAMPGAPPVPASLVPPAPELVGAPALEAPPLLVLVGAPAVMALVPAAGAAATPSGHEATSLTRG